MLMIGALASMGAKNGNDLPFDRILFVSLIAFKYFLEYFSNGFTVLEIQTFLTR